MMAPLIQANLWICCSSKCHVLAVQIWGRLDFKKASICSDWYEGYLLWLQVYDFWIYFSPGCHAAAVQIWGQSEFEKASICFDRNKLYFDWNNTIDRSVFDDPTIGSSWFLDMLFPKILCNNYPTLRVIEVLERIHITAWLHMVRF